MNISTKEYISLSQDLELKKAKSYLMRTGYQWAIPIVKQMYNEGKNCNAIANFLFSKHSTYVHQANVYKIVESLDIVGELKKRSRSRPSMDLANIQFRRNKRLEQTERRKILGEQVVSLCKEGKSYSQIMKLLNISRGQVAGMIRDFR
jgi:transposase